MPKTKNHMLKIKHFVHENEILVAMIFSTVVLFLLLLTFFVPSDNNNRELLDKQLVFPKCTKGYPCVLQTSGDICFVENSKRKENNVLNLENKINKLQKRINELETLLEKKLSIDINVNITNNKNKNKDFSDYQKRLLTIAYHIGKEIGYPETIQSILIVETQAGKFDKIGDTSLPPLKRSYGVMQVKLATAKYVLKKFDDFRSQTFPTKKKNIHDEEIIVRLITDDVFNIKVAALYFLDMKTRTKSWRKAVVGYNTGYNGLKNVDIIKEHFYYKKVVNALIRIVRPFNKEYLEVNNEQE